MSDINLGTGMVTIALASLIIGTTFSGHSIHMLWKIISVVIGSILYRFIISIALRLNVPTEAFKLVSAVIVAVAIMAPQIKSMVAVRSGRRAEIRQRQNDIAAARSAVKTENTSGRSSESSDKADSSPQKPYDSLNNDANDQMKKGNRENTPKGGKN